jgi:peptidoglycan/LPS O-acetylase OafA/YrhL
MTLKYTESKYENFNKLGFLISRYIRFTPQLVIFLLLSTLLPLLGSGPIWIQEVSFQIGNCYKNWWQDLIYLQNFIDVKNMVRSEPKFDIPVTKISFL